MNQSAKKRKSSLSLSFSLPFHYVFHHHAFFHNEDMAFMFARATSYGAPMDFSTGNVEDFSYMLHKVAWYNSSSTCI